MLIESMKNISQHNGLVSVGLCLSRLEILRTPFLMMKLK